MEDHYISESNHSLSCTVVYDANSTIYLELQFCNNNTFKPITTDPLFTLRQFPELKVVGLCIRQRTVLYTFNFTQVSAGLFLRCSVTDYSLNINKTTECVPLFLQPPGNCFTICYFLFWCATFWKYNLLCSIRFERERIKNWIKIISNQELMEILSITWYIGNSFTVYPLHQSSFISLITSHFNTNAL